MMKPVVTAFALTLGLASCGAGPETNTRKPSGAIGPVVRTGEDAIPPNYRELVAAYLRQSLLDPTSLKDAGISEPAQRRVGFFNGRWRPAVCVRYDAKNARGAYTGSASTIYWFRDGKVAGARRRQNFCADAAYGPFPEASGQIAARPAGAVKARRPAAEPRTGLRPASTTPAPAPRQRPPAPGTQRSGYDGPPPASDSRTYIDERRGDSWFRQL